MSKKKTSIEVFHGLKKRVFVGNVKHSEDEKDISLIKPVPSHDVYLDMNSVSGNNRDDYIFFGAGNDSFLGLVTNTSKAKKVITNLIFDSKIVKTQVEISIKKFFVLDINLSAVERKSAMAKTQFIRKIFSLVNGFGGATTLSKFEKIIRSMFTSEESIIKAASLAREKEIDVNSNLKKQEICLDWAVVIKKIPMNTPKKIIVTALAEFGEIKSIKIQLIGLWQKTVVEFAELDQTKQLAAKWSFLIGKDLVCVAITVNRFRALLFTLLVGTTAHNLGTFLDGAGGKTCVINCSMNSGNWVCCAVVGFKSGEDLESVYHTEPIFGNVKLSWTRLDLVCCEKCEHFGHSALECNTPTLPISKPSRSVKRVFLEDHHLQLVKLYTKKSISIFKSAAFGGKSWAQAVSLASSSSSPYFDSGFGSGSPPSGSSSIKKSMSVYRANAPRFFSNLVLRKAIMNKQFCYLVSAVLQSIISYRTQFSFVMLDICYKWNIMIRKSLKVKAGLPYDFPSKILHYLSLYGLKPFEQVQSEKKLVSLISFSNGHGIFERLFDHRFLNLQVLGWSPLNPLQFFIRLHISSINNFLAEVVKIFLENELFLANNLPCAFHESSDFLMSGILGQSLYYRSVFSLKCFGVAFGNRILNKKGKVMNWKTFWHWKQLDPRGPVPYWFSLTSNFMNNSISLGVRTATATKENVLSVLDSDKFSKVHDSLLEMWSNCIEIYTDRSLRCAGSVETAGGAAAYFLAANIGIGVKVTGLLSSTLIELQAVMLALECVPSLCLVVLYSNSQSVIDAYISEAFLSTLDFHNQCWIERLQIVNLLKDKNISIKWVKVKEHSDVLGNIRAKTLANETIFSFFSLPVKIQKRFLEIDWDATVTIWHLNSHMLSEFTNRKSVNLHTYLMKAVYKQLSVAHGVLCLLCDEMEFSDYVFICSGNFGLCKDILMSISGLSHSSPFAILLLLLSCFLNVSFYMAICKDFVMRDWYAKAVSVFERKKKATQTLVEYIRFVVELQAKHRVEMEKAELVGDNGVVSGLSSSVIFTLSASIVHMLGVIEFFAVRFGRCKLCHFFSDLSGDAFVTISV
ncbi:hypothetical protein G9A89_015175 [Geosiphon pyriformis]|nr:hypothetical protein G9A89_015175 [Geosiphon pyriformis]